MQIQPAKLTDITACCQLDMSYSTEYVWQLQRRDDSRAVHIRFDTVRLPRPMQVAYPRDSAELNENWQRKGCFLVAYNPEQQVIGFLDAHPDSWHGRLTVLNLVVDRSQRRKGVATALLRAANRWAAQVNLQQIMCEVQTKNSPAISFMQKHSFLFCGYNELYYPNGDITLFFARSI